MTNRPTKVVNVHVQVNVITLKTLKQLYPQTDSSVSLIVILMMFDIGKQCAKCGRSVNVERQCGVMKHGNFCHQSLACKSHSIHSKRAVTGRSQPYDILLVAYLERKLRRAKAKTKQQSQCCQLSRPCL